MATNLLNNQLKQIQKLGKDVENLEKKLNKVFGDVDEEESPTSGKGRNASNLTKSSAKSSKSLPREVTRISKKCPVPKHEHKNKRATLEVTVKTKRHGKSNKQNDCQERGSKYDSRHPSKPHFEESSIEGKQRCCCSQNSKNMVWSSILKHSDLHASTAPNSRDGKSLITCEAECSDRTSENCTGNNCPCSHSQLLSHKTASQHVVPNAGKGVASSDLVSNDFLNSRKCSKEDSKDRNIPQLYNVTCSKSQIAVNGDENSLQINGSSLQPIDRLCMLMEELRRTTANQPTQALVQDMEAALKKLCKNAEVSTEDLDSVKFSSKKVPNGDDSRVKMNNNRLRMSPDKPRAVANAMVQVPSSGVTDGNDVFVSNRKTDEGIIVFQSDPLQNGQRKFAVAEKFELLVKVNDDNGGKRQYILGNDEKLKAEIEYLNKQLNLQLKSVEGLSTKESEYHKLISSLIEKVDKLETQVNEQTKVTQHFYSQCNTLMEQNSVIPKMQKRLDHLNKQLQDANLNYEKLKIECCVMKLEKDKLYAMNCEKEKEINKFKEEIIKIQALVSQQIQNVGSYVGYSSAAEKVDKLLSVIDSQSNVIKLKINDAKEFDEGNISSLESSSPSSSNSQSRPISPFSFTVRLNSPDRISKPPGEADIKEGNTGNNVR